MTNFKSPFSAHSTAIKSSFSLLSMNQFKYFTMLGWSKDYGMRLFVIDCAGESELTYLVQLNFFQAAVALFFVVHVEDFDQLQSHHALVRDSLGLEHIGELPLACRAAESAVKWLLTDHLANFEAVNYHAHVQHHIVLDIRLRVLVLRRHLRLGRYIRYLLVFRLIIFHYFINLKI